MLILFSDVHLTDGSSSETINDEAFDRFADRVVDLVRRRSPHEVRLVLLGDGLDLVRSSLWLDRGGVRPWSPPGRDQEGLVLEILRRTLHANRWAVDHLLDIPARIALSGHMPPGPVCLDYVLGNHDWLINRYPSARRLVAERLRLGQTYADRGFPFVFCSPADDYDMVARHGDIFDRLNCAPGSDQETSSLGDAIVIELLSRLPLEVGRELDADPAGADTVRCLKEIDNVRPMTHIAAWVLETVSRLGRGNPDFLCAVDRALERVVSEFRRDPRIRGLAEAQLSWLQRWYLWAVLADVRRRQCNVLNSWPRLADFLVRGWHLLRNVPRSKYAARALEERGTDGLPPRFVVYGHSHRPESVPLGPSARDGADRFYLNTGTWRTVWQMAENADAGQHFACWKEMSYVVLYSPREAGGRHEFEVWTGSLRDRPSDAKPARLPEASAPAPAAACAPGLTASASGRAGGGGSAGGLPARAVRQPHMCHGRSCPAVLRGGSGDPPRGNATDRLAPIAGPRGNAGARAEDASGRQPLAPGRLGIDTAGRACRMARRERPHSSIG